MVGVDMKQLGLKPREMQVLRYAAYAARAVPGGRHLVSDGQRRAAERLVVRKFLTKARAEFTPPVDWLVVRLTKQNMQTMRASLKREQKVRAK